MPPLVLALTILHSSSSPTSLPIQAPFPIDEATPSWNATVPEGGRLTVELQARQGGEWGPWYMLGEWTPGERRSMPGQNDDKARVSVDTLELKTPADAVRYKVTLEGGATLELFALALSVRDKAAWEALPAPPFEGGRWVRELKVETRSQTVEQPEYRSDICSPTSLSMAASFWKVRRPTADWVRDVYDSAEKIYGNWPFNIQAAYEKGLRGWVTRLTSMEELQREIAAGRPTVVSLTFAEGELDGAPLKKTPGHLLVVRGFTKEGDVIVNDPAAPPETVRRIYKREQFRRVWLRNKRGLAYKIVK